MMFRLLCCLLVLGCARGYVDQTVVQYLAAQGFNTLSSLLKNTSLDTTLSGQGPFTIFAPTDAAFAKLPSGTVAGLNAGQLSNILKYHVISEFLILPMIQKPTTKTTVEGQAMDITPVQGSLLINNASRTVTGTDSDVVCNNGVVHAIDTVLMPPKLATNDIYQILLMDDRRFKDLSLALLLAGLTGVLEGGEYTLFAPVDAAFAVYKDNLLDPSAPNAQKIYQEVLKYHVVPGSRRATQLSNGQYLYTLHGVGVNVTVDQVVRVNTATVIDPDILATNGVIHAIDTLLLPPDMGAITGGAGRR